MYYCWGDNSFGQLGIEAEQRDKAGLVRCRPGASLGSERLVQAACGEHHSLLLLSDGTVWSCGSNVCGQLGRKNIQKCTRPAQIQALETQAVVLVSCGKEHSLAVCKTGEVFSWGSDSEGQLGIRKLKKQSFLPKKIQDLSSVKIIQVSCGYYHSIALAQDGKVFSWGKNSHGQLGLGENFPSQSRPQWVKSLNGIPLAQVSAGGDHSFALSLSGTSYGWGKNNEGQLALSGKNVPEQIYKPCSIGKLKSLHVTYISCGDAHTAVLTKDGKVFTFGSNNSGQLGCKQVSKEKGPQIVDSAHLFSQIACGSRHTLAYACTTGQVVSFGCGSQSQLNSLLQPGSPKRNFNISNLISTSDFTDVQVKDIFAGADANFVTTLQSKDVSSSCATGRSLQQISQINQTLINKWTTVENGSEEYEESKREIHEIFSNLACLTASFLKKRTDDAMPIDVDLQMARDVFGKLTQKDWITNMITTCLRDYMLKYLPWDSPHQEALSIFLLLPECPVMHTLENLESLVVPFAKAVFKVNDQSSEVLEKCWESLEESSFNSLIQMLKKTIVCQMDFWLDVVEDNDNIKALLGMLKKLHRVNKKAKYKVPESTFYISELHYWPHFYRDLERWYFWKKHPVNETNIPVTFADFPFVFDLPSKTKMLSLNRQVITIMTESHSVINRLYGLATMSAVHLNVRRSHLVEDTLCQLSKVVDNDLKKELKISIIGETPPEGGGVRKEFFHCLFKEMIQPEYEMFMYSENSSLMWFPTNPKFPKKSYFLFGVLYGLSIVSCNVANLPFPLALYKKLLDQKPSLEDLQELSPELGNNLKLLLDENADDIEEFDLRFSIYWDKRDVDLIPNGSSILVDKTNKEDFVSRCIDYVFNTSVKKIYKAFQTGFYKVCIKEILSFFNPEELKAATTGNLDYDWKSFEENSQYFGGYDESHPTIVMFWDAFHRLSLEKKKEFLVFLTGNDRFQAHEIEDLGINFVYPELSREDDPPKAQTCFHRLFLPPYSTMEKVEKALQIAINNNRRFMG
ncbi:probable E3 ubiquitin-protein ligase HERC6 isoform X2 [Trichosurus vulpecula]|uniref:probable E3 ubiquitin-protein ligase HERC6 isoform X2 n=1 Tax=Trichosurus vulpecula TaxID=9337 RepID=UPI00186B4123|nr:probable E3 ubiquitin-protein ligase HERC6 isoform X2 [Trichosurus vulpecula]